MLSCFNDVFQENTYRFSAYAVNFYFFYYPFNNKKLFLMLNKARVKIIN